MDVVTLITIIAIGAVIATIALFVRQRGGASDEDYDEEDEDVLDDESDIYDDDDDEIYDDESDEDEDGEDEDCDEESEYDDSDEYDVEELPFEAYKATVVSMDIERRQSGSSKRPSSHLVFLVEFKIQKRIMSEVITLDVPEEIYSDIKIGEYALLVVQGRRFIDFGDRYAEDADEKDIKAEQEKTKGNKKTKAGDK